MGLLWDVMNGKTDKIVPAVVNKSREHDIKAGMRDRKAGYYDKWYRYNRKDNGAAYDEGQKMAMDSMSCPADLKFIECMH